MKIIPERKDVYKKTKLEISLSIVLILTQLNKNDFNLVLSIVTYLSKRLIDENNETSYGDIDLKEIKKSRNEIVKILIDKIKFFQAQRIDLTSC